GLGHDGAVAAAHTREEHAEREAFAVASADPDAGELDVGRVGPDVLGAEADGGTGATGLAVAIDLDLDLGLHRRDRALAEAAEARGECSRRERVELVHHARALELHRAVGDGLHRRREAETLPRTGAHDLPTLCARRDGAIEHGLALEDERRVAPLRLPL